MMETANTETRGQVIEFVRKNDAAPKNEIWRGGCENCSRRDSCPRRLARLRDAVNESERS